MQTIICRTAKIGTMHFSISPMFFGVPMQTRISFLTKIAWIIGFTAMCARPSNAADDAPQTPVVTEGSSTVIGGAPVIGGDVAQVVTGANEPGDPPVPVVTVKVRVPAQSGLNEQIRYCICVENCSVATAHHVVLRSTLPDNARFVCANQKPLVKKKEIVWALGTMQGGDCCEIVMVLQPLAGTAVRTCARVQYEHGQCVTTRLSKFGLGAQPPIVPVPQPPVVIEPPKQIPPKGKEPPKKKSPDVKPKTKPSKLTLTMSGPAKQYVNIPTTYRITVENAGPGPATNIAITNDVPAKSEYISSSPKAVAHAGRIVWLLGDLQMGESRNVEIVLRAKEAGLICNRATAIDDWQQEVPAEKCTIFQGIAAVMFEMVDKKDPLRAGDETSYHILVRNQGNRAVTNIRIRAMIPKLLQVTRARGPADNKRAKPTPDGKDVIEFDALAKLEPGKQVVYEVFAKGVAAGDARFAVEMTADQLTPGFPVREEESTIIFLENGKESKEPPQVKREGTRPHQVVRILPPILTPHD